MLRNEAIRRCLIRRGWIPEQDEESVALRFLAQGEYNENWLFSAPKGRRVLRINHGSQLGLTGQIEYEFRVLKLLENSGVTPRPLDVATDFCGLDQGALLMEYLPGKTLDYERDAAKAARIFARIHSVAVPEAMFSLPVESGGLVCQPEPVRDIATESLELIERHLADHALPEVGARLLEFHAEIMELYAATRAEFAEEPQVLVNTEVNSGNFLIEGERAWLVDWEKAVLSSRHQDLGHFLTPTTTLWKTDYRFSPEARRSFLREYAKEWHRISGETLDFEALDRRCAILEQTILLRGLSWCFMAYHEYTATQRALRNADTFAVIKRYLDNSACFLA
ncbi:MAG: aminoglycoside phosphotransferase family protein [Desulfovibrio sp.]